jgi:hypothetical protein
MKPGAGRDSQRPGAEAVSIGTQNIFTRAALSYLPAARAGLVMDDPLDPPPIRN